MSIGQTVHRVNGIDMQTLKSTIDAIRKDPAMGSCKFHVRNQWVEGNHNRTTVASFYAARQEMTHTQPFELHADEPPILAGEDQAPNPVEHLLNALASCLTTSMVAHAAVRGIELDEVESEVEGDIDLRGFLGLAEDVPKGYQQIRVNFKVKSRNADADKLKSLAQFSPVYNTLLNGVKVDLQVTPK